MEVIEVNEVIAVCDRSKLSLRSTIDGSADSAAKTIVDNFERSDNFDNFERSDNFKKNKD